MPNIGEQLVGRRRHLAVDGPPHMQTPQPSSARFHVEEDGKPRCVIEDEQPALRVVAGQQLDARSQLRQHRRVREKHVRHARQGHWPVVVRAGLEEGADHALTDERGQHERGEQRPDGPAPPADEPVVDQGEDRHQGEGTRLRAVLAEYGDAGREREEREQPIRGRLKAGPRGRRVRESLAGERESAGDGHEQKVGRVGAQVQRGCRAHIVGVAPEQPRRPEGVADLRDVVVNEAGEGLNACDARQQTAETDRRRWPEPPQQEAEHPHEHQADSEIRHLDEEQQQQQRADRPAFHPMAAAASRRHDEQPQNGECAPAPAVVEQELGHHHRPVAGIPRHDDQRARGHEKGHARRPAHSSPQDDHGAGQQDGQGDDAAGLHRAGEAADQPEAEPGQVVRQHANRRLEVPAGQLSVVHSVDPVEELDQIQGDAHGALRGDEEACRQQP